MPNRIDWNTRPYKDDPKHYDIFFCGDSWTFGGELDIENPDPNFRETNIFSYYVGQRTNKSVYNMSRPGESNDWIARSVVDWFECGNSCDTAVIQWTFWSRISYYNSINVYHTVRPQSVFFEPGKKLDPIKMVWKDYYEHCYTDYSGCQMWAKNLCFIDLYLKDKGVKPIYLTIKSDVYDIPMNYYSQYKKAGVVKYLPSLLGYKDRKNYDPCVSHPNSKGHSIIADYIISQL